MASFIAAQLRRLGLQRDEDELPRTIQSMQDLLEGDYEIMEEFEEPSEAEIRERAKLLGIQNASERNFLFIARASLLDPLPSGWTVYRKGRSRLYVNEEDNMITHYRPDLDTYRERFRVERLRESGAEILEISASMALTGAPIGTFSLLSTDLVQNLVTEVKKATGNFRQSLEARITHQGASLSPSDVLSETGLKSGAKVEVVLSRCSVNVVMNRRSMRVLKGSPVISVRVGSEDGYDAAAQDPPARNDTWEVEFQAEQIEYDIEVIGGDNAHHGILHLFIDDVEIGEVDQYAHETTFPTTHVLRWQSTHAGEHKLRGVVSSKNRRAHDYWCCLQAIRFHPVVDG
eukprot:TRINITY_DN10598_c0_g1_i1.p1 TRINITY_DN10598_c0_g1~~TRINITY_DN10598_c0_g1_i1.p1  ORF type:complete len:345 (+),score=30.40 TRINITY_DN10598_c0_g1_i1:106-1140(+)